MNSSIRDVVRSTGKEGYITRGRSINADGRLIAFIPVPVRAPRPQRMARTVTPTAEVGPGDGRNVLFSVPSGTHLKTCVKETGGKK
jgi:hypothetical protein